MLLFVLGTRAEAQSFTDSAVSFIDNICVINNDYYQITNNYSSNIIIINFTNPFNFDYGIERDIRNLNYIDNVYYDNNRLFVIKLDNMYPSDITLNNLDNYLYRLYE